MAPSMYPTWESMLERVAVSVHKYVVVVSVLRQWSMLGGLNNVNSLVGEMTGDACRSLHCSQGAGPVFASSIGDVLR